jgi:CDP-diacylglycerol--serine O-phosphatidyltransferase
LSSAATGRLRYLAPNAVTVGSILIGWVAILRCLRGDPHGAAWFGLWAVFTDRLDGLLARALDAQSEFGTQMDSLADLISFGVAPAVIAYAQFSATSGWGAWPLGAVCALHLVCAATRLARYNVRAAAGESGGFVGFPTTMTAAFLFTFFLSLGDLPATWAAAQRYAPLVMIASSIGMVVPLRVPRLGRPKSQVLLVVLVGIAIAGVTLTAVKRFPEYGVIMTGIWFVFAFVHHARTAPRVASP